MKLQNRVTIFIIILLLGATLFSCASATQIIKPNQTQTIAPTGPAWLGVNAKDVAPKGVLITEVYMDSPALKAGLKANDVIIAVDGQPVNDIGLLTALINHKKAGDTVKIKVTRIVEEIESNAKTLTSEELSAKYNDFVTKSALADRLDFQVSKKRNTPEFAVTLSAPPKVFRSITPPQPEISGTKQAGFMGISMEPTKDLDKLGQPKGIFGMKITSVTPLSPADKGGLRNNDIVLSYDGTTFASDDESNMGKFSDYIKEKGSGATIGLTVLRRVNDIYLLVNDKSVKVDHDKLMDTIKKIKVGETVQASIHNKVAKADLKIVLGVRMTAPVTAQTEPEANDKIHPQLVNYSTPIEQLALKIMNDAKFKDKYDDLLKRYADDEKGNDEFRLRDISYMHRDPFKIPKICDGLIADLRQSVAKDDAFLDVIIDRLDAAVTEPPVALVPLKTGLSLEEHCQQLSELLQSAEAYRQAAFAGLTQDDIKFLENNIYGLTERWQRDSNFADPDEVRTRNNIDKRVIQLCDYVDYQKLFASAKIIASMLEPNYLNGLKADIIKAAGEKQGVLYSMNTPLGKIIIGGKGDDRYDESAAIIIDIGGNDFYANSCGGSIPGKQPFSIIIDYGGDDTYYSYTNSCQGAGVMGVGMLVDLGGNNKYIAENWGQGAGLLGVGILIDKGGYNTYRGQEFVQGAGLFGIGILINNRPSGLYTDWDKLNGSNYYSANQFAQGMGGPKGCGLLFNAHGNNIYRATGKYPNGYPENVGTFEGWSQGCGTGFRSYADGSMSRSGGIGILIDNEGGSNFEAGTFSQGGGYFFGWGILANGGGDNTYLGTRYSQGFAAHSAIGYFIGEGGHNSYRTLCGVTSGLSWDLTGVVFIEKGDHNTYDAGGFSLGASAHNGFCLFEGLGSDNSYQGAVAKVSGNNYHGGSSLSVFLNQGNQTSTYSDGHLNNTIETNPDYSIFIDTNKPVEALLANDTYKRLMSNNIITPVSPTAKALDRLSFKLTATIILPEPEKRKAFVCDRATDEEKIYQIGSKIDGNWTIMEISNGKMTIQNPQKETYTMALIELPAPEPALIDN